MRLLDVLGRRCELCGAAVKKEGLCQRCSPLLAPRLGGYCPGCGEMFLAADVEPYLCGSCRLAPRPFSRLVFHGPYEGALREAITGFKFHSHLGRTALLARLASRAFVRSGLPVPDLVVPVPLHPRRLKERGFNQSLEIGRLVARELGTKCASGALVRSRETPPQASLSFQQRQHNLTKAFVAQGQEVAGKEILIVDDVMTTGGTLNECAKVLKKARAGDVAALVVARTPKG